MGNWGKFRATRDRFWQVCLAVTIAADLVILGRYHYFGGFLGRLRSYRGMVIALFAALLVALVGGCFIIWRSSRDRQSDQVISRHKLCRLWCWGALRGGAIAALGMPVLVYEEFEGPRLIIFAINTLEGCPSRMCVYHFLGPVIILIILPFVAGLVGAIVSARKKVNFVRMGETKP